MTKTRKKSGLRRAHKMYQGSAVAQNAAIAAGCSRRKASRQRLVKMAQKKIAPPLRRIAAGPLASTARPRKKPKRSGGSHGVRGRIGECSVRVRPSVTAAQTMAIVSVPLKGISVAAAWEKPIMPTQVGSNSMSHRAVAAPYTRSANQAIANVASSADTALGKRAAASLTPKSLKLSAALQ